MLFLQQRIIGILTGAFSDLENRFLIEQELAC